jgi:plasmid rolling circle replication initiator protein Rep
MKTRLEAKTADVNANPLHEAKNGEYLSDLSPKDKPWDRHRANAVNAQTLFAGNADNERHAKFAKRINDCALSLEMGYSEDEKRVKLKRAYFCHVRWCPVCQWRKSLAWKARLLTALPKIQEAYPNGRWLFLTLTVKNCDVANLRSTLADMGKGWQRLSQLDAYPALGEIRSTEVTYSQSVTGDSHPHFHILMLVPHGYFQSGYLKHEDWVQMWRESMRLDYDPGVHIRTVRPKKARKKSELGLQDAIAETLKYSLKVSDLEEHADWFLAVTDQLHKTRAVNPGGVFRKFLRGGEPDTKEMTEVKTPATPEEIAKKEAEEKEALEKKEEQDFRERARWHFDWTSHARRYALESRHLPARYEDYVVTPPPPKR